jgi:hypothetical protein
MSGAAEIVLAGVVKWVPWAEFEAFLRRALVL